MQSRCWSCRWGQPLAAYRPEGPPTWIICRCPALPTPIGAGGDHNDWPEIVTHCDQFRMKGDKMETFEKELERLLNRTSQENASNTPDFILAQYMLACLSAFNVATQQRETWYGRDSRPTSKEITSCARY